MSAALKMAAAKTHDIVDTIQSSGSSTKLLESGASIARSC